MNRYGLFKVKRGKLNQWKQWCFELDTFRRKSALQTLKRENSSREYYVHVAVGRDHYVVASSEYFAPRVAQDETEPLNKKHKEMLKDCLVFLGRGITLCDLTVDK